VSKLCRVIRHRTYDPVRCGLPHGIEETTEYVEPDPANVSRVVDINLVEARRGNIRTCILPGSRDQRCAKDGGTSLRDLPLVEVRPDVHDEDHTEEDAPTGEGAKTTAQEALVQ
jgi:hypothetical protein